MLGWAEVQAALQAIYEEVSKRIAVNPSQAPVSVAIVDDQCELIGAMRMDGAATPLSIYEARKMAYTAARMRIETRALGERAQKIGRPASDYGDVTVVPGGVWITEPGVDKSKNPGQRGPTGYGGIGVAGAGADQNEELAFLGLRALQKACWGSAD